MRSRRSHCEITKLTVWNYCRMYSNIHNKGADTDLLVYSGKIDQLANSEDGASQYCNDIRHIPVYLIINISV